MATALAGCGKQQEQVADAGVTVFVNGTVLPVDAAFSTHEALAISGSRILAVGSRGDVLAAAGRGAMLGQANGGQLGDAVSAVAGERDRDQRCNDRKNLRCGTGHGIVIGTDV